MQVLLITALWQPRSRLGIVHAPRLSVQLDSESDLGDPHPHLQIIYDHTLRYAERGPIHWNKPVWHDSLGFGRENSWKFHSPIHKLELSNLARNICYLSPSQDAGSYSNQRTLQPLIVNGACLQFQISGCPTFDRKDKRRLLDNFLTPRSPIENWI